MVRKNQRISNHHILPPTRRKHHNLCNIITRQRLYALINLLRLLLIASKSYHTKFRLDLPRVDLNNPHTARNQLLAQAVCKRPDSCLCSAVDAAALIRLATRNRADVYDVAAAAVGAGKENG